MARLHHWAGGEDLFFRGTLFFVLALLSPLSASVIVNGDFETGDLTGWTRSGNAYASGVGNLKHSGSYGYEMGPPYTLGYLSQTFDTTPGEEYTFSFWLTNGYGGGSVNEFTAYWAGTEVLSLVNADTFRYEFFSFNVTAVDFQTEILFSYRHDADFFGLDDVAVEPTGASAVPEPSSLALLGVGGAAAWWMRRRGRIKGGTERA